MDQHIICVCLKPAAFYVEPYVQHDMSAVWKASDRMRSTAMNEIGGKSMENLNIDSLHYSDFLGT